MGATDSKENSKLHQLYQNYTPICSDDTYGECQILQSKRSPEQKIILREYNLTDEYQFNKMKKKYEAKQKLVHENILNISNFFHIFEQQLCGQFFKIYGVFECPQTNLLQLFNQGKVFSESEIWDIMIHVTNGLDYLQKNGITHNSLTLQRIYLTNGQFKVSDPSNFNQEKNFTQILQDPFKTENIYLPPILVHVQKKKSIQSNNWQPKHNPQKSDIFTLAMILIQLCLQQQLDDCYKYEDGKFFEDILQKKILSIKGYSKGLINTFNLMLLKNEDQRPDYFQLNQIIQQNINLKEELLQQPKQNMDVPIQKQQILADQPLDNFSRLVPQSPYSFSSYEQIQVPVIKKPIQEQYKIETQQTLEQQTATSMQSAKSQAAGHANKIPFSQQQQLRLQESCQPQQSYIQSTMGINLNNPQYQVQQQQIQSSQCSSMDSVYSINYQNPSQQRQYQVQKMNFQNQYYNPQTPSLYTNVPCMLQYDRCDTIINSDQVAKSCKLSIPDEISDPKDLFVDDNCLRASKKFENMPNALTDHTNLYYKQSQINYQENLKSNEQQKYILNSEIYGGQKFNERFSNTFDYLVILQHTINIKKTVDKSKYSLPFDLPHNSEKNLMLPLQNSKDRKLQNDPSAYLSITTEQYSNGSRYEGQKFNGMRHGKGKFYYQDGGLYDGEWKENKMHGKGSLFYASGKPAYEGDWNEDKFHGIGVLHNEIPMFLQGFFDYSDFDNVDDYWVKYEGQFFDDNKEGSGTMFLSNGERFVGNFSKDIIDGNGLFYCKNGRVIDGRWQNNKLV